MTQKSISLFGGNFHSYRWNRTNFGGHVIFGAIGDGRGNAEHRERARQDYQMGQMQFFHVLTLAIAV